MDQVKQQVWIAEGLIDQYGDVLRRYLQAYRDKNDNEQSVLHGEIGRIYPGIWEQLDSAAKLSSDAGRDIGAFSRIRSQPGLETGAAIAKTEEKFVGASVGLTKTTYTFEMKVTHNEEGIQIARQAADALKSAWPELDWTPPATPEVDLGGGGFFSRLLRKLTR
jgi:hypothetical protein